MIFFEGSHNTRTREKKMKRLIRVKKIFNLEVTKPFQYKPYSISIKFFLDIITMANNQLPFHVRATDAVHRLTVLGLVGICVVGGGSIAFNIWANSDYAPWNKEKLKFQQEQYHNTKKDEEE